MTATHNTCDNCGAPIALGDDCRHDTGSDSFLPCDVAPARAWLLDCADSFADDPDDFADTVRTLNDAGVESAIARYYDGGVSGFLSDLLADMETGFEEARYPGQDI